MATSAEPTTPKKPRGRPRKTPDSPPEASPGVEALASAAAAMTGADDAPPNGDAQPEPQAQAEPKKRGRPRGSRSSETARREASRQLESALAEILTMPAIGFAMVGDEFCADHFSNAGPHFAKRLVDVSERQPQLRSILEKMVTGETVAVLLLDGFAYLMPPLVHHGLPAPEGLRRMLGVPEPLPSPHGQPDPFSAAEPGAQDPDSPEA